ncbi:uncharacterized protein LOC144419942 [Styela clava]
MFSSCECFDKMVTKVEDKIVNEPETRESQHMEHCDNEPYLDDGFKIGTVNEDKWFSDEFIKENHTVIGKADASQCHIWQGYSRFCCKMTEACYYEQVIQINRN